MKKIMACMGFFLLLLACSGKGELGKTSLEDRDNREKIVKVLELARVQDQMKKIADLTFASTLENFRSSFLEQKPTDISQEDYAKEVDGLISKAKKEFQKAYRNKHFLLLEQIVSIWEKHMTGEEIDYLLRIYEDPMMRGITQKQSQMTEETMRAGEKWGEEIGREIAQSFLKEHDIQ